MSSFIVKPQDTLHTKRLWFNFGLQGALITNKSFSNITEKELSIKNTKMGSYNDSSFYSPIKKPSGCFGFSGGLEFKLGKGLKLNHVIDLNYDYTNSSFNFHRNYTGSQSNSAAIGRSTYSTITNTNIKRIVQFIDLGYGVTYNINNHFNTTIISDINYLLKREEKEDGYKIFKGYTVNPPGYPSGPFYDSTLISTKKIITDSVKSIISLKIRLGYNFKVKQQKFNFFVLRNIGALIVNPRPASNHYYLAPWWLIGIQYWPLKK